MFAPSPPTHQIKYIADPSMHSMPSLQLSPNASSIIAQSLDNQVGRPRGARALATRRIYVHLLAALAGSGAGRAHLERGCAGIVHCGSVARRLFGRPCLC